MSESTSLKTEEVKRIDIDSQGDIVMLLEGTELKVSSKVLAGASPVFKALISPGFREGNALQAEAEEPVSIEFPEDDAYAITSICQILHKKEADVEISNADQLENIALMSDKYDCWKSLSHWGSTCVTDLLRDEQCDPCEAKLLFPAVYFEDGSGFKELTENMTYSQNSLKEAFRGRRPFPTISLDVESMLPETIIPSIWQHEWHLKQALLTHLETVLWPALAKAVGAGWSSFPECECTKTGQFIAQLHTDGVYPSTGAYERFSLKEIVTIIWDAYQNSKDADEPSCALCCMVMDKVFEVMETENRCRTGVCLDCIKMREEEPHTGWFRYCASGCKVFA